MADEGGPSSSDGNPSRKRRIRTEARKEYDKKRDASRVFLFDAIERWRTLKEDKNFKTDQEVADFLLDIYDTGKNKTHRYIIINSTIYLLNLLFTIYFCYSSVLLLLYTVLET